MKDKSAQTIKPRELNFDDFYEEVSRAWQRRAKQLRVRRWKKIKQMERRRVSQ